MATRKVIEIDVQDSSFTRFAKAFAAFSEAVKSAVGDVRELDKAQAKVGKNGAKWAEAETKAVDGKRAKRKQAAKEADEERKREAADQKKKDAAEKKAALDRKRDRAAAVKSHKELAKWTADVAWNTGKAALNVAKWVALGGLAGGFGLGALAASASGARRQSQGLGIDTGELRAAGVNFGKYIDPEAMLGKIADAQSSYGRQNLFNRVGVDPAGKNPAELLADILPKLVQRFRSVGGKQEGAEALGLTEFATMDDLRRLSKLTEKELSDTIDAYRADREKLKVDDSTSQDWQSFMVAIHRAGQVIETSLVKHLAVLAPKLEEFAKGVAKSIDTFLSNADLEKWLKAFSNGIARAAKYLGSDEFQADITKFMHAMHKIAAWLGEFFKESSAEQHARNADDFVAQMEADSDSVNNMAHNRRGGSTESDPAVKNHNPGNLRVPGSASQFQKFSSDDEGVRAMASQLRLYEDRDGLDTIAKIIAKYAPSSENDTRAYIANVSQRTGLGANDKLDLHDSATLSKVVAAMAKQENSASSFTAAGVKVVIENNTGGNTNTTLAALGN